MEVIIMPSYHISSSGKLVKCKSDPCKLHAGTDFHAENLKEAQKMAEKAIMNNNNSTKTTRNVKLSENTQKLAQNYYNNLLNYAEGYNYENEMEAAHGLRSGEHWRARIANIKKLDALNDAREALKGLMPTYDWPIDSTRKVPESFLKAVGRFEIAANAEKADSNDKTRAARDRAWNKVRKEVQKVFSETIKEVDITPEPY